MKRLCAIIKLSAFISVFGLNAQTTEFKDNFNGNSLSSYWGVTGPTFAIADQDSVLKITYNRNGSTNDEWGQIHLAGISVNVDSHPYISVDIKSDVDFVLAIKPVNF